VDYRPADGGVTVYDDYLKGFVWASNIGWLNVGAGTGSYDNTTFDNYGVNNDGSGNLSGFGWNENAGWVNFSSLSSQVVVDSNGNFSGYGWNENIGWTNFSSLGDVDYKVKTDWNPAPTPTPSPSAIPTSTPTATHIPTATPAPTVTPPPTTTPTITPGTSCTPTPIPTPSVEPTATSIPTCSPSPSVIPTASPIPTPVPPIGNIDSTYKWSFNENAGWLNFCPEGGGVTVYSDHLEGWARADNIGWVHLKGTDYQVNNDGSGNLSGYGWSENAGWVSFSNVESKVTIDGEGNFSGYGYNYNIGWTNFSSLGGVDYRVKTSWIMEPTPTPSVTPTPTPTPEVISVSLDVHEWNIGIIGPSGTEESVEITAINDGNVTEEFTIHGADGTGGWTIEPGVGQDRFMVKADVSPYGGYNITLADGTSPVILDTGVGAAETVFFKLQYSAPSNDTKGSDIPQGFTITITASKP